MATANYCSRCLTTFHDDAEACPNLGCGAARPARGWGQVLGEGDLLDRHYRITRVLAVGGAGITYQARAIEADGTASGPELAIKVLFPERDSGPFLRRLANEAQILQDLAHPHIVACRGFVQREGHPPYLVTRFEPGGTLGAHVARVGSLSPFVAAAVLDQVLDALQVAHDKGIVHRDLKPDNVLLAAHALGRDVPWVRVADFGIAKVFDAPGARVTKLGTFIGTPEYAAPEQFEGLTPTPATDVFAAGALLFHLLVGRPPVEFSHRADIESDHQEMLKQIPPKLPEVVGPAAARATLQALLDHTMIAVPGERWTVSQVRAHLADLPPAPRPSGPPATQEPPPVRGPTLAPPLSDPAPSQPPEPARTPAPEPARTPAPEAARTPAPARTPPPSRSTAPRPPSRARPAARSEAPLPSSAGIGAGVVGLGAILFFGSALAVVVLGLAAWGFGWFGPGVTPTIGTPVALDPVEVVAPVGAAPIEASAAERAALEASIKVAAPDLALLCKPHGSVALRVVVEPDGRVRSVAADPGAAARDPDGAACVERAVARMALPRTGPGAVAVTVTLSFPR